MPSKPTVDPVIEVALSMLTKYGRQGAIDWACHYASRYDAGTHGRRWWDDVLAAIKNQPTKETARMRPRPHTMGVV